MIKIVDYGHMKVSDLIEGFMEDTTTGQVSSMNGKLNIRPAYQREFVYKEKQRNKFTNMSSMVKMQN